MKMVNTCFLIFLSSTLFQFSEALVPSNISLDRVLNDFSPEGTGSMLHDFRIEGCNEQPCNIRKGQALPFEVDLSFVEPAESADSVYFNVFMPKYAAPPAVKGTKLITATCEEENLGFECPITSNKKYTLKSSLFIDSDAQCTSECAGFGYGGTGLRETKWRWTISDNQAKKSRKSGKHPNLLKRAYSVCTFRVTFNILA